MPVPKRTFTKAERALATRRAASAPKQENAGAPATGAHYVNLTNEGRGASSPASTNVSAVTTAHITGGKRHGKSMRRKPRETASANLTRRDIEAALAVDSSAVAYVTKRGVVKRLDYKRT